jgi:hypothetical protein
MNGLQGIALFIKLSLSVCLKLLSSAQSPLMPARQLAVRLPSLPVYSQSTFLGRHHVTNPTNFGRHGLSANIDRWLPPQRNTGAARAYKSVHNAKLHLNAHSSAGLPGLVIGISCTLL